MARIVFMGTPDFAVPSLEKLIVSQEVVGVVTQPDRGVGRGRKQKPSPVKVAAQKAGIPVYQPKSLRSTESAAPLIDWAPDLIVVAAFGQILRPHILELPASGSLNVHASLLPRWRGASPIQHAILGGDTKTGISLMKMDEGLDTGPVYNQEAITIYSNDTAETLHDRLANLGAESLARYLPDILSGNLKPIAQDNSSATYAPMINKQDGQIDWADTSGQIERHIRAMTPWPSAFTYWCGQLLKVWPVAAIGGEYLPIGKTGEVVDYQGGAAVLTETGGVQLSDVQVAGKRRTSISEFLRGRSDFIGSQLPN
jgi:methionyl-tRNA formyltransferase